jgi:uncharacterized glyoxalase superfamily protein PhnB
MPKITPELIVPDVDAALDYYQNILGFERVDAVPAEGPKEWALLRLGQAEIMLESAKAVQAEFPALESAAKPAGAIFYLEVENMADFWPKIEPRAEIIRKLYKTPYDSQELALRDLNGFILIFGERAK